MYLVLGGVPGPAGGVPTRGVYLPGGMYLPGNGVYLPGGLPGPGGVPGPGGCTWSLGVYLVPGVYLSGEGSWSGTPPPPLVNRMTNWCKNITLPQTSFAGNNNYF